jgi:hypothetical protein
MSENAGRGLAKGDAILVPATVDEVTPDFVYTSTVLRYQFHPDEVVLADEVGEARRLRAVLDRIHNLAVNSADKEVCVGAIRMLAEEALR